MTSTKAPFTDLSSRLRILSTELGQVPALLYLVGYLFVIFIFSLIYYYVLPGYNFYHSTTQYEYQYFSKDVADPILHNLRADVIQAYYKNGKTQEKINGWRFVVDNLHVDSLDTRSLPSEFSFQVVIPINDGTEGNWNSWTFLAAKITVFTDSKFISNDIVYSPFQIESTDGAPIEGIPSQIPSPGVLFNYELIQRQRDNNEDESIQRLGNNDDMFLQQQGTREVLPLSLNSYNEILELGQSIKGFPLRVDRHYLRMLYFSTGIATSKALGDIVPVSALAKLFVTLEAIIEIILIAFFLNSLVYDFGNTSKSTTRAGRKTK